MGRKLPDRWNQYSALGQRVEGTKFIAFKVPLQNHDIGFNMKTFLLTAPKLGIVIDLTNTYSYYDSQVFSRFDIQYQKLKTIGQEVPCLQTREAFNKCVLQYLNANKDNDKLIGVHCTHGVNRSGFLICNFMISHMSMLPADAIKRFEEARGHCIERQNYVDKLLSLKKEPQGIRQDDVLSVKGEGTSKGVRGARREGVPVRRTFSRWGAREDNVHLRDGHRDGNHDRWPSNKRRLEHLELHWMQGTPRAQRRGADNTDCRKSFSRHRLNDGEARRSPGRGGDRRRDYSPARSRCGGRSHRDCYDREHRWHRESERSWRA